MKNMMKSVTEWTEQFSEEKPGLSVRVLRWFVLNVGIVFLCVVLLWLLCMIVGEVLR